MRSSRRPRCLWLATTLLAGARTLPLALAGVLVAEGLPVVLFAPLAGALADRHPSRALLLACDAIRSVATMALGVGALAGWGIAPSLSALYAIVLLNSVCSRLFNIARLKLLVSLVPRDQIRRASGPTQLTLTLAGMIGPAIAALVFARNGAGLAFLIDGASFWASFASIAFVGAVTAGDAPARSRTLVTHMRDGLRLLSRAPDLMTVLVTSVLAAFAAGAVASLLVLIYLHSLHGPPAGYGLFVSAAAVGSLVAAVVGGAAVSSMGPKRTYVASNGVAGVVLCGFVVLHSVAAGCVVQLIYGLSIVPRGTSILPIVVEAVEPDRLGGVMGLVTPLPALAAQAGAVVAGCVLAFGSPDLAGGGPVSVAVLVAAALYVAAAVAAGWNWRVRSSQPGP
jgi:MFS family permease